jgi:hypothetical protein
MAADYNCFNRGDSKSKAQMTTAETPIHVAADGTLTAGKSDLTPAEHEEETVLVDPSKAQVRQDADTLLERVRAIQQEIARLPVLDYRTADEIIGHKVGGNCD